MWGTGGGGRGHWGGEVVSVSGVCVGHWRGEVVSVGW